MRVSLSLILAASLATSACSQLNPRTWFGQARAEANTAPQEEINPLIPERAQSIFRANADADAYAGTPVAQVTDLRIDPVPGGAILRATGTTATQGAFDVQLTPENEDLVPTDGILRFRLEAQTPSNRRVVGSEATRRVVAALALSDQELRNVRRIEVIGVENRQIIARR